MSTVNDSQWIITDISQQEPEYGLTITFPDVVDGKIDTKLFLAASRATVKVIEKFGKVFASIKYDMQINIEKLTAKYMIDKQKHSTIQDLILMEKISGKKLIAVDALIWLLRTLKMVQLFLIRIVERAKTRERTEDLVANIKDSYTDSLEPYHGWMAQQLFSLLARMVPSRSQLLLSLANNVPNNEDNTLRIMGNFAKKLEINITTLQHFLRENNLEVTL